jgi:hypothetical protein
MLRSASAIRVKNETFYLIMVGLSLLVMNAAATATAKGPSVVRTTTGPEYGASWDLQAHACRGKASPMKREAGCRGTNKHYCLQCTQQHRAQAGHSSYWNAWRSIGSS